LGDGTPNKDGGGMHVGEFVGAGGANKASKGSMDLNPMARRYWPWIKGDWNLGTNPTP
jgi:hypothetical protein